MDLFAFEAGPASVTSCLNFTVAARVIACKLLSSPTAGRVQRLRCWLPQPISTASASCSDSIATATSISALPASASGY